MAADRGLLFSVLGPSNCTTLPSPFPESQEPSKCDMFYDAWYADHRLDTLSATVLHELLHNDFIRKDYQQRKDGKDQIIDIMDYHSSMDPDTNANEDPPNGYGPYNAMRLKQTQDQGRLLTPLDNDDSYVWFAK
jgi:hypothetical protein